MEVVQPLESFGPHLEDGVRWTSSFLRGRGVSRCDKYYLENIH